MPQAGPSKGDFFAVGIYGQYIYVNPAMNIVIAKNAADREFTQPQSNGQHSMNMNVDIFRSLAEQLSNQNKAVCFTEMTDFQRDVLKMMSPHSEPYSQAIAEIVAESTDLGTLCKNWSEWTKLNSVQKTRDETQGDFGEAFALVDENGNPVELSDEEIEIVQKRIKKMEKDVKPLTSIHRWELDDAKCELRDEWVCEATLHQGEVKVILPLYEDAINLMSDAHEADSLQERWHKITDIVEIEPNVQRLTIQSQYWEGGERKNPSIEVILNHGKPQYQ